VGVEASHQFEVTNRFEELKKVVMPFISRAKCWKPDLHHVWVLSTSPLFHGGKVFSKLSYGSNVRKYGELFIYVVQTCLLAMIIFQTPTKSLPGVFFKYAIQ